MRETVQFGGKKTTVIPHQKSDPSVLVSWFSLARSREFNKGGVGKRTRSSKVSGSDSYAYWHKRESNPCLLALLSS